MTDNDIFDWIERTHGGATNRLALPTVPGTAGNGLTALIPEAGNLVLGRDFGRTASLPAAGDGTTHPAWVAATSRILLRSANPAPISNLNIPGYIDINPTMASGPVSVSDCVVTTGAHHAFNQPGTGTTLDVNRCELIGALATMGVLSNGTVSRSYMHGGGADGPRPTGASHPKRYLHNLVRNNGKAVGAHTDGIQIYGTVSNVIVFGGTFYMPFTGSTYDEGAFGTTNTLRFGADGGNSSDLMAIGCALIGAGWNVNLFSKAGTVANGQALIGCRMSAYQPGNAYTAFGNFYPGAPTRGRDPNILIHNCTDIVTGAPVLHQGQDANGLWNYDKTIAPPNFLKAAQLLGYVDWNGDALAPVRTGFHTGTVV